MLNSSLNELFKLPVLFSHFIEHRSADKEIDIIDFVYMHYFGNDMNEQDNDRDMELPFKKIQNYVSFEIAFTQFNKPYFKEKHFFPEKRIPLPESQVFNLANPSLGSLFRPPII